MDRGQADESAERAGAQYWRLPVRVLRGRRPAPTPPRPMPTLSTLKGLRPTARPAPPRPLLVALALLALATTASAQTHPLNAADAAKADDARPAARVAALAAGTMSATVDDDIFLQGTFVSIGISGSGSFGTANVAPSGFVRDGQLGYIFDDDGFGMGDPAATGDFFLPGAPEEGFTVGYRTVEGDDGTSQTFTNVEREFETDLTTVSVEDLSAGDQLAARYVGVTPDNVIQVTQTVSYDEDSKQIAVVITMTNVGDDEVFDVRYLRNVDPDQDEETTGSFTTRNTVLSNFPADGRAVVQAEGVNTGVPFLYAATDSRLRASYGGFANRDPYAGFLYDNPPTPGVTNVDDEAVTMTADVGSLMPGESKTFQFFLGFEEDIATDPLLTLSASPLTIGEGGSSTITATIAEPSDEDVVVTLAFSGTATRDADFTAAGTITIPTGMTSASITLDALADGEAGEPDESAVVDIESATNAIEQGEQRVTVTIADGDVEVPVVGCSPDAPLAFGDFDTDGDDPTFGEFAAVENRGDGATVDLSACTFVTFNPFSERVTYSLATSGTVVAGAEHVFASMNGDQAIPDGSIPDGPGAIALIQGAAPVGSTVRSVLGRVVAAVVYFDEDRVVGRRAGGNAPSTRSSFDLGDALQQLAQAVGPVDLTLAAWPNPSADGATVAFGVAESARVRVTVYDVVGREVVALADRTFEPGRHEVSLAAGALPAGVYVVRVASDAGVQTARLTVAR